jgi:hypothetical protein
MRRVGRGGHTELFLVGFAADCGSDGFTYGLTHSH